MFTFLALYIWPHTQTPRFIRMNLSLWKILPVDLSPYLSWWLTSLECLRSHHLSLWTSLEVYIYSKASGLGDVESFLYSECFPLFGCDITAAFVERCPLLSFSGGFTVYYSIFLIVRGDCVKSTNRHRCGRGRGQKTWLLWTCSTQHLLDSPTRLTQLSLSFITFLWLVSNFQTMWKGCTTT